MKNLNKNIIICTICVAVLLLALWPEESDSTLCLKTCSKKLQKQKAKTTPTEYYEHIGIRLSETCRTMLENNMTTNCPNYLQILHLYPDTSIKKWSGDFYFNENGFYEREIITKKYDTLDVYYSFPRDVVWIDPPSDVIEKIKIIEITSHDFVYPIKTQKITNSSYLVGQSRWVSPNCDYARISSDNWIDRLGDTWIYLRSGCDKNSTNYNDLVLREWNGTIHDITTSYKYQLDKWYNEQIQKVKDGGFLIK